MADGFFGDSTYGSLSGMQSSSSSFTMSLSGSDTVEDQPSTSGCSSDMTHSKQQKERRKERVKHYLKQLKAMVPPTAGSRGKMGTLSALAHVVDSMKKIQEEKEKSALENQDVYEKGLTATLYEGDGQLPEQALETRDCLRITLRGRDFTIMNVSSNLHELLGYPMLSWNGRDLIHFIHKKDVVTVNSNLAYESESVGTTKEREDDKEQDDVRKYFYFRIRHYKSLQSGFSLMKTDQYTAFQASVALKTHDNDVDVRNALNQSSLKIEDMEADKCPHKYLVLECVPLKSAYGIDNLQPERMTFTTRHTLFCSFSYMHPNAIPLLGYLPQDMVGMSIFDFYHQDDMEKLYNTYKQVVSAKGTPIKGAPIRFRTRNGSYVVVETEWSSFANPWSRRLEFIIGQHTVIKGPDRPNVFSDRALVPIPDPNENVQRAQQKIRQLLLQPIVEDQSAPTSSQDEKMTPATFSGPLKRRRIRDYESESEEGLAKVEKIKASPPVEKIHTCEDLDRQANTPSTSDVSLSSQQLFQDNTTSVAYEQLNYTNNIKKFLLSQPRSYSSKSDSKSDNKSPSSSNEESDDVEFQEDSDMESDWWIDLTNREPEEVTNDVEDFEVDISVPKPPSFGSSTKVLLSEQGQREEVASSPAHPPEEIQEEVEPMKEVPPPTPVISMPAVVMPPPPPPAMEKEDHPRLMQLTQETLMKHTKLQEKIFVNQANHERNLMKHQEMPGLIHDPQRMKRTHSPDSEVWTASARKAYKQEKGDLLQPPFPLNVQQQELGLDKNQAMKAAHSLMDGCYAGSSYGMYPAGVPRDTSTEVSVGGSSLSNSKQGTQWTTSQNVTGKMQWPFYPQAGVSFIPQVMGGFYQQQQQQQPVLTQVMACSTVGHPITMQQGSVSVPVSLLGAGQGQMTTRSVRPTTYGYSLGNTLQPMYSVARQKLTSTSDFSSTEETSSSFLYLLELDDNNSTPPELQETDAVRHDVRMMAPGMGIRKRVTEPPWLQTVHWTHKLSMMYTVPRRKKNRVLKEDRDALSKMKHQSSDMLLQQMKTLQEETTSADNAPVIDEESDYLFPLDEDELQKLVDMSGALSDRESSDMSVCSGEQNQDNSQEQVTERKEVENDAKSMSDTASDKLGQEKAMSCDSGDQEEDSPKGMLRKSDTEASLVECESNCSKTSSDLTPSDQRSNEEVCSSLKESDGSMKEIDGTSSKESDFSSNEIKESSESEQDTKKVPVSAPFDVFFVPLPVKFPKKDKCVAPWLEETEMNPSVAMEYSVSSDCLKNRLKHDKLRLRDMMQPDLVKQQFEAMLMELSLRKSSPTRQPQVSDSSSISTHQSPMYSRRGMSAHQKQREFRRKSRVDDKLFDGLFISMFNEEPAENSSSRSESVPDIEDVSNSLDEID